VYCGNSILRELRGQGSKKGGENWEGCSVEIINYSRFQHASFQDQRTVVRISVGANIFQLIAVIL